MADTLQLQSIGASIVDGLGDAVRSSSTDGGELVVNVERESIVKTMTFLRDNATCQFKQLMDICGVDYPHRELRFDVVYNLLSLTQNTRIRVKITTDEQSQVPSISSVFSSATWWEREAWDLYGILFSEHPDLRRILTDYGFVGHPLRKDFPLTGYLEVRYDDEQKRVIYEPVKLTQEYRNFDFLSPWEGMQNVLPGDEKSTKENASDGNVEKD